MRKRSGGSRREEVAHIARENHGDARKIAQSRHDAAGFKLRKKAGGKARVAAEFDQAHGLALTQILDAVADALGENGRFDGFGKLVGCGRFVVVQRIGRFVLRLYVEFLFGIGFDWVDGRLAGGPLAGLGRHC